MSSQEGKEDADRISRKTQGSKHRRIRLSTGRLSNMKSEIPPELNSLNIHEGSAKGELKVFVHES